MKKITLILSLLFSFGSIAYAQNKTGDKTVFGKKVSTRSLTPSGHVRCSTDEYEEILMKENPKRTTRAQFDAIIAPYVKQYLNAPENASQSGGIIYIPVVVHVIHNGDAYGVDENITDEQVQSQITVMTQDFRRMAGTPGFNSNAVGADVQIEFVLAKVDPNGNPTNGINHVNLCKASYNVGSFAKIEAEIDANVKPQTIWDPTQYMNMWSVNWDGSGLLGYAQFPSNGTATANSDGVVSGHTFFGSRAIYPAGTYADNTYDKGRTMTHEVGHFLGLFHTFQGRCTGAGDNCADTPAVGTPNYGCPAGTNSCPANAGNDMIENYMDYTDDTCMNIFTNDQKAIVVSVMNTFPRRTTLKTSNKDIAIPLFANDAEVIVDGACITNPTCANPNPISPTKTVLLYNRGTSNLTSATLSYNFDGGSATTQNWTGNLAPNKYAVVTLTNSAFFGLLSVSVTAANGGADQRATNNTATKTFASGGLVNAATTTFTFNLTSDGSGAEVTWNLKNQAGITLYSGGPYTNLGASGTQTLVNNATWTLPANGCYYLTVNDSYGDGLFDGAAQGFYTVTAGATTLVDVQDFAIAGVNDTNTAPVSRVSSFTNNLLSNDAFSLIENAALYPNPSKDFFTISVPEGVDKKGKVEIYNNLGQKIITKNISSENDLSINVSAFANGIYFVNLTLGEANKTLRFIKE